MVWPVAHSLGLDHQLGIDLQEKWLPAGRPNLIAALQRGDADIISSCTNCNFPFYQATKNIRDFAIIDQFSGFIVVGRKGAITYDSLIKKGMTPKNARLGVLKAMRGKTFDIFQNTYGAVVSSMLRLAKLSPDYVKINNFQDDATAATAFLGGTGDYYMGSLPQETKLLLGYPDRFVRVGGREILGPAGLWYSTEMTTDKFLANHHDVALKLLAILYRTNRYINARAAGVIPVVTDTINAHAATQFSPQEVVYQMRNFLRFLEPERDAKRVFARSSDYYWLRSLGFYGAQAILNGVIPRGLNYFAFNVQQPLFGELQKNKTLMTWIYKPLRS
jgi:ABC-type nitrate/sulfonate/bicarbonate transport system substrate-binding protein